MQVRAQRTTSRLRSSLGVNVHDDRTRRWRPAVWPVNALMFGLKACQGTWPADPKRVIMKHGVAVTIKQFTTAAVTGITRAMHAPPPLEFCVTTASAAGGVASEPEIDRFLAAALSQEEVAWPTHWAPEPVGADVVRRIAYHGISGLLSDRLRALHAWPREVLARIRELSLAQAMWETRHRIVLARLLGAFAEADVCTLFLKGTGLAYDLYQNPAARARGDTDLLVARDKLQQARQVLTSLGFVVDPNVAGLSDDLHLQEIWRLDHPDESRHDIDVHWQVMNSFALSNTIGVEACFAGAIALPRLARQALTLDHVTMLVHTALHKATHIVSPYFSDGQAYYGGDRLIWSYDIHLLAQAFSEDEWTRLLKVARKDGIAEVCLAALVCARDGLGTHVPGEVLRELKAAVPEDRQSSFLLRSGQLGRAWQDLQALVGWRRKVAFMRSRVLPPRAFVRAKYPELANQPLLVLYLRRAVGLVRKRPGHGPF